MYIHRLGGKIAAADTTEQGDYIDAIFEADAAISAGAPVMLDATANTSGLLVVDATAMTACVGIYTGVGGTGAAAGTGFTGNDAADGDRIRVRVYGHATANVAGNTTAVSANEALAVESAGVLAGGAAVDNYAGGTIIALEATTAAAAAVNVFVRAM